MPRLSLSDLVKIVSSAGGPKAAKVAEVKNRPKYEPAFDFYKPLREAIVTMHEAGTPKATLDKVLTLITDEKKLRNYPRAIEGYKKWLGRNSVKWFDPPRAALSHAGVDVIVNPELGLEYRDVRYIVKLHFTADALSKQKVSVITCAMEDCLRPLVSSADTMSVLDVRRAKLFPGNGASPLLTAMLEAELTYIASLWDKV